MVNEVPVDGPGFLGVLRKIVPLARSMRCSYRGPRPSEVMSSSPWHGRVLEIPIAIDW